MGKRENTAIVVNGLKEGKSDDDILQELYAQDIPFGELRTVFNDIIKEKGLRLTAKERKEKTVEIMEGVTAIETVEDMQKVVANLVKKLKITETKAMGSLRTWAKGAGIELPKAPRVSKARKVGFGGNYKTILDWMLENREATKAEVVAFCHDKGIPEAYSTQAINCVHFAKVWNGEVTEEAESEED